jgi:asparagine N-glycosylation enzyme membrane subunit Stt3
MRASGWARRAGATGIYCAAIGAFLAVRAATTLAGGASFGAPGDGWRSVFQLIAVAILAVGLARGGAARASVGVVGAIYATATVLELFDGSALLGAIPVDMRDRVVHPLLAAVAVACVAAARRSAPASSEAIGGANRG